LAPEKVESDSNYFLIPHFAKNWVYDANSTMGITVYGNGGMNTDYPGSAAGGAGTFGAGAAGVNLEQLFINGSYARKFNATNSFGVSLVFAYQRFKATGLNSFAGFNLSNDGNNLSNNGTDTSTGFGFKLGWQGEVTPELTLAASYQSEMQMSEFDKYKGLFAEQGGFNIPATWTVGLAYSLPNKSKVVLDVQKIMYSDIKSIGNPLMPALGNCFAANGGTGAPSSSCLGGDNGPGFGWEDMTVVKIGYQWAVASMPGWTWRAGYSKGDQPIPDSEVLFNILAPGVMEQHLTFGFTKELPGNREFNFAFMYAPENDITGPNPLGDGQRVTLKMRQWEIEGSYSW
jgi:long-chain fatty acid transport protein